MEYLESKAVQGPRLKVLAIIPARGGSKGLPRKNIVNLAGKPLIAYSIDASLNSKYITKTVVSSEDDEILEVAEFFGAHTLKREEALAQDDVKTEPVLLDVLEKLDESFDYMILLQATSPLRTAHHIDEAMKQMLAQKAEALISVYEPSHSALKAFMVDENSCLKGIVNDEYPFSPRQLLPKTYYPNGAIYIIKTKEFMKNKSLFIKEKTAFYVMDECLSLDIDTQKDLEVVEMHLKSKEKRNDSEF